MKKIFSLLLLILTFCLIFSSCGSETTAGKTTTETGNTETQSVPTENPSETTADTAEASETTPVVPTESDPSESEPDTTAVSETEVPTEPTTEVPTEPTTEVPTEPTTETPTEQPTDDEKPVVFSCNEVEAKAGKEVKLTVSASDNPGLAGYSFTLCYDPEVFEFVKCENKVPNGIGTVNSRTAGKVRIMRTIQLGNDLTFNGPCCEVTLKVKDGAKAGSYEIPLMIADEKDTIYTADDVINFKEYPSRFVSGKVTVVD